MRVPNGAKRVFKGIIFDVYQWRQKLFDGSPTTFEAVKRPNTVEIIATQGRQLLVARQQQPRTKAFYCLFSGRQDKGETPLQTAKRELLEEGGLASDDWELYKTYEPSFKIDYKVFLFIARNCRKVAPPSQDAGEKIGVEKVTLDQFFDLLASESFRDVNVTLSLLRILLNSKKREAFARMLFG